MYFPFNRTIKLVFSLSSTDAFSGIFPLPTILLVMETKLFGFMTANPLTVARTNDGVTGLQFSALDACPSVQQVCIGSRQLRIAMNQRILR